MTPSDRPNSHWYSWHVSSCVIAMLCFFALLIFEVPGQQIRYAPVAGVDTYQHGWPFVHLTRHVERGSMGETRRMWLNFHAEGERQLLFVLPACPKPNTCFWSAHANWNQFGAVSADDPHVKDTVFYLRGFLLNGLIVSGMSFLFGVFLELRRRRRSRFLQVNLRDAMLAMGLVAIASSAFVYMMADQKRQAEAEQALLDLGIRPGLFSIGVPQWLMRLTDNRCLAHGWLDREWELGRRFGALQVATSAQRNQPWTEQDIKRIAENIDRLPLVQSIFIDAHDNSTFKVMYRIDPHRITRIAVVVTANEATDLHWLTRYRSLESLDLNNIRLQYADFDFPVFPRLRVVHLGYKQLNTRVIDWIRRQPRLRALCVEGRKKLDDTELRMLQSKLPDLQLTDSRGNPF